MHWSLSNLLMSLLDLWIWEAPGWVPATEGDMLVVRDGDGIVVAGAPLKNTSAVRRLKALADTVNLIHSNVDRFRDPYTDSEFTAQLLGYAQQVESLESDLVYLREENARLRRGEDPLDDL